MVIKLIFISVVNTIMLRFIADYYMNLWNFQFFSFLRGKNNPIKTIGHSRKGLHPLILVIANRRSKVYEPGVTRCIRTLAYLISYLGMHIEQMYCNLFSLYKIMWVHELYITCKVLSNSVKVVWQWILCWLVSLYQLLLDN